jgi:Ca2+-binding RTX toxin-like protein
VAVGGRGNDVLDGERGADLLRGGPGADFFDPGPGRDVVQAGPGNDTIVMTRDKRADTIYCGPGKDHVGYYTAPPFPKNDRLIGCEVVEPI